ncbi:MAG: hypothetical protein ABI443_06515 [Chthoniobacterales bacterium]
MSNILANTALKAGLNHKLKEFGEIKHLDLDAKNRSVVLSVNLVGETVSIDLTVKYRIEKTETGVYFVPEKVECSRQWITLAADKLLGSKAARIEIPAAIASIAVKFLEA